MISFNNNSEVSIAINDICHLQGKYYSDGVVKGLIAGEQGRISISRCRSGVQVERE